MPPIAKKEGVKYPTILNIHGGPSAMWGPGIFSMWHEYQLENSWVMGWCIATRAAAEAMAINLNEPTSKIGEPHQ